MNEPKINSKPSDGDAHGGWNFIATALVAAFVMNWLWEMAQMAAYRDMAEMPWMRAVGTCTVATVGDVVMTLLAYAVGAGVSRNWRWTWVGSPKVYAALATLGLAMAVIVERVALAFGRWNYNEHMPVIPGLDVGVLPILQLTVLVPLSYAIACVRPSQKNKRNTGRTRR